jgi:hypothetical protein
MDIMELGAIGELVGGVAVIATLIYLALQVRDNTRSLRATGTQQFADSLNGWNLMAAGSVEQSRVARMMFEEPENLTADESYCADAMMTSVCRSIEAALLQRDLGALHPQTDVLLNEMVRKVFAARAYRAWWQTKADYFAFTPLFSDIVNRAIREQAEA